MRPASLLPVPCGICPLLLLFYSQLEWKIIIIKKTRESKGGKARDRGRIFRSSFSSYKKEFACSVCNLEGFNEWFLNYLLLIESSKHPSLNHYEIIWAGVKWSKHLTLFTGLLLKIVLSVNKMSFLPHYHGAACEPVHLIIDLRWSKGSLVL